MVRKHQGIIQTGKKKGKLKKVLIFNHYLLNLRLQLLALNYQFPLQMFFQKVYKEFSILYL